MSREKVVFQAETAETVTENIQQEISEEARENSQTENGVFVKGMALPFGQTSRNGVQYEKQSVKQAADDLKGRPILFNHKQDFATGHILNIEITEDGMFYEGDLNPNAEMPNGVTVAEAVERGDIRSPSIQAFVEQTGEEADEDAVVSDMQTEKVKVADFIEISMVTVPGFPKASAMPEHLQQQGVKPVTELAGTIQRNESLEEPEYEEGDFLEWEFGEGTSQGKVVDMTAEPGDSMSAGGNEFTIDEPGGENDVPLYKLEEWDEDEQSFTNNVVKFEDELSETERPEEAENTDKRKGEPFAGYDSFQDCVKDNQDKRDPEAYCGEIKDKAEEVQEQMAKEQFEFSPVPTHVLYDTEEKAQRRAENLGLEGIHEHQMGDQIFYMAGENHEAWINAIERENPLDRGEELSEALSDVDLTPPERVKNAAQAALDWEEENPDRQDCGTGVGDSRANSITNETLSPEDFLGGENTAIPDYLDSHEEDVTAEGPPTDWSDEEMNDCGNRQYAKWGFHLEWFQDKQEELQQAKEKILGEDQSMTEQEEQDENGSSQTEDTKSEQVTQEQFIDFVAEHMEGLDSQDIADAVGDSNFTGLDQGEVAELLASEYELDFETVMDAIGQLEDMEGEAMDDKDDEDDEEEEENSENQESSEESSEKSREELKGRIDELEERLEKLVKEDEGKSKQETPDAQAENDRFASFSDVV
jgi:phage head maturation protease